VYCTKCGQPSEGQALFCQSCGARLQKASQEPGFQEGMTVTGSTEYAGFWKRLLASFIDGLLVDIPLVPPYILFFMCPRIEYLVILFVLGLVLPWLYFAIMESSSHQATLGKMALGIMVTDTQGRRIPFARATGRDFGKIVSGLILYIGHIMIAFTERKQGLHDIMAGCLVVVKRTGGSTAPAAGVNGRARGVKKAALVLVVLTLLCAAGGAAAYMALRQKPSGPDIVASLKQLPMVRDASNATWSPDGMTILYEAWPSIWKVDHDGGNRTYLGEGRLPTWSPDGSRIAFVTDDGLEVMNADGGDREMLLDLADIVPVALLEDASVDSAVWSPDGSRIAFVVGSYVPGPFDPSDPMRQTGTSLSSIWIMNSDGTEPKRLTTDSAYEQGPNWSPDGQSVTFVSNRSDGEYGRWTSKVDGSGQPEPAEGGRLSPDGTRIAYVTEDADLWLRDADGGNAVRVAGGSGRYYNPTWSPDGTMVAFESVVVGPVGNIWIVNADGSGKTKLTGATKHSFDCTPEWISYKEPQWSPDGTKLLFINGLTKGNTTWGYDRLWVMEVNLEKGST